MMTYNTQSVSNANMMNQYRMMMAQQAAQQTPAMQSGMMMAEQNSTPLNANENMKAAMAPQVMGMQGQQFSPDPYVFMTEKANRLNVMA